MGLPCEGPAIARPPCHRPPDEALHDLPTDRWPGGKRREGFDQHTDCISLRAGPPVTVIAAATSRTTPSRSARRVLRRRGRADADGGAGATGGGDFRRDATTPSGSAGRCAPHPGAAHPFLAGTAWRGPGGHLPAGP